MPPIASASDPPVLANHELQTTRFFWRKLFRAIARKLVHCCCQVLQPAGFTKEIWVQVLQQIARRRKPPGHEPQQTFGWGPSVQGGVPKLVVSWHSTPFMGRLGRWTPSRNSCKILSSLEGSQASSSEFVAVELWPPNVGMCQADKANGPEVHHHRFLRNTTDVGCVLGKIWCRWIKSSRKWPQSSDRAR